MSKASPQRIDLVDQRFGLLVVTAYSHTQHVPNAGRTTGVVFWKAKCDCGRECVVRGPSLKRGLARSCGQPACKLITRRETLAKKKAEQK